MQHYLDDPDATAAAIDADGFLHTGDLATMDERGYVRIIGRLKDMIIVGGFNVYPAEVENALLDHPAIGQVAVIGVPDERMGEVGMAWIVPGRGSDARRRRDHRLVARADGQLQGSPPHRHDRRTADQRRRQGRQGRAACHGRERESGALMEFSRSSDHEAIREGIRRICADFPDEYWAEKDEAHEFPWDFYNTLADGGWVGIAIPEEFGGGGQGITEASVMLEEIAASGAAMNGCSAIHLSIFGMEPVRRYASPELAKEVLDAGRVGRTARRVRGDRARRRHRHHLDPHPRGPRRRRVRGAPARRCGPPRRRTARCACCSCAPRRSRSARSRPTA